LLLFFAYPNLFYNSTRRLVTGDDLEAEGKVPAALNLPPGKLFFGYAYVPYTPPPPKEPTEAPPSTFSGSGNTLSGRGTASTNASSSKEKEKEKAKEEPVPKVWGSGQTLGTRSAAPPPSKKPQPKKERSPTPDWGVDDDDVIVIDSD